MYSTYDEFFFVMVPLTNENLCLDHRPLRSTLWNLYGAKFLLVLSREGAFHKLNFKSTRRRLCLFVNALHSCNVNTHGLSNSKRTSTL